MEGKPFLGAELLPNSSYRFIDLQGSMQVQSHNEKVPYESSLGLPQAMENVPEADPPAMFVEFGRIDGGKGSLSDEEEGKSTEDVFDGVNDATKGKKSLQWHRVKWTDKMVMTLITAVSYIGEDSSFDYSSGGRRKTCLLQKKGKWKTISKVMAERGFYVSPQQCEDKFNDLNKRYKRLNDILGRGTSCEVVENHALLDSMNLSEKSKEDVRKILKSKQLFYEQMCSYHNGNRLNLPHDLDLQRSLQLALRRKDECEHHESRQIKADDMDDDDEYGKIDDQDGDMVEDSAVGGAFGPSVKRMRQWEGHEETGFENPVEVPNGSNTLDRYLHDDQSANQCFGDGFKPDSSWEQWMMRRSVQLEEKKLHIQAQVLELEKEKLKWQRLSKKQDRELERMRLENECMKLENERIELELKHRERNCSYG